MSLPPGATQARRVSGGDINDAWQVVLADGTRAFVKTRPGADAQGYATEAAGLQWLAEAGVLRVPRVLDLTAEYLALEWIEPGTLSAQGAEELGRGLAQVHAAGAPDFGGPRPLRIGALSLPNEPCGSWAQFYAQQRLLPLATQIGEGTSIERVCARLEQLVGPPESPARLHGDLWQGNVLADEQGRPWLIDPAAYGGHREVDLAMYELFGGRNERMLAAYVEANPLADGHGERVVLWQLFPLLVHAVLFGGSYVQAVRNAAQRYF